MKTLNISISDVEFQKFGLKEELSFSELLNLVGSEMRRSFLQDSIILADRYNLSSLTAEEIDQEVKAVRANAKNNS